MDDPIRPLQDISFRNSTYERPNQKVVHVALADAEHAVAKADVQYTRPVNQRIQPVDSNSNESELDITPRRIQRSLRRQRGMFSFAVTALTIGLLCIGFNSTWKSELIAPGPLSSPHGQILMSQGSDRCAACHQAANQSFGAWMMSTVGLSGSGDDRSDSDGISDAFASVTQGDDDRGASNRGARNQSQLCMKCHEKSIPLDLALSPHNVDTARLASITAKITADASLEIANVGSGNSHAAAISCNACHREHHGNVSLSLVTDHQCQSCHAKSFHSFADGHPEFRAWPHQREQHIAFNHSTHVQKHFPQANRQFDCNACHIDDALGDVKLMASYEQACAACHNQQIVNSGDRGWTLLSLPMVDISAIEENGFNIGNWPMAATGDFDGPLPPMMRLLLSADEEMVDLTSTLQPNFSFADIDPDQPQSIETAVQLIRGIKRLILDLASEPRDSIATRLTAALGSAASVEDVDAVLAGLDPEIFAATAKRWLPDLEKELGKERSLSLEGPDKSLRRTLLSRQPSISLSRQRADDRLLAMRAMQELLATNPVSNDFGPDDAAEQDDSSDADLPKAVSSPRPALSGRPAISPKSPAMIATQSEIRIGALDHALPFTPGWYRNDAFFRIGYRPSAHADPVVKAWSDLASRGNGPDATPNVSAKQLLKAVADPNAVGSCASCHASSSESSSTLSFQWHAHQRDASQRSFTKFSHRPHLVLKPLEDCSRCHQIDLSNSQNLANAKPVGTDGAPVSHQQDSFRTGDFLPMTKADCASCHRKGGSADGCTTCHHYHVEPGGHGVTGTH